MPRASLLPNKAIASLVSCSRFRKLTMFPKVFTEFKMRFVREKAWMSPWDRRFLSTQSVLSVVASKPVRNMLTTMTMSISRRFSRIDRSL